MPVHVIDVDKVRVLLRHDQEPSRWVERDLGGPGGRAGAEGLGRAGERMELAPELRVNPAMLPALIEFPSFSTYTMFPETAMLTGRMPPEPVTSVRVSSAPPVWAATRRHRDPGYSRIDRQEPVVILGKGETSRICESGASTRAAGDE